MLEIKTILYFTQYGYRCTLVIFPNVEFVYMVQHLIVYQDKQIEPQGALVR